MIIYLPSAMHMRTLGNRSWLEKPSNLPQIGLSDVIIPGQPLIVILIKASFLQASLLSPLPQASMEMINEDI